MKAEFIHSLCIAVIYLGMFGIGEILFHFFHVRVEITRKFSHLSAGIIAFLFPLLIKHHILVLILAVGFTGLLIITKKTNLLKSIHSVKRVTFGSYLYPLSIYVCFLLYSYYDNLLFYFLPLLILTISDTIASIGGKVWAYGKLSKRTESKTLSGSALFFFATMIISLILFALFTRLSFNTILLLSTIISLLTAVIEAISYKGVDNITIPLTVISLLILFKEIFLII